MLVPEPVGDLDLARLDQLLHGRVLQGLLAKLGPLGDPEKQCLATWQPNPQRLARLVDDRLHGVCPISGDGAGMRHCIRQLRDMRLEDAVHPDYHRV